MTKISDVGDLWVETVKVDVTLQNAAGFYFNAPGTSLLSKPGRFVGGSLVVTNAPNASNSQVAGIKEFLGQGFINPVYGTFLTEILIVINKQNGTSGATLVEMHATVFLKK